MIELRNIKKIYNKEKQNECKALDGISLAINDGEMTAIMGRSGAGKSTLMHIISFIDIADDGEYLIDGKESKKLSDSGRAVMRNEKIGIVLQDYALVEDFTVYENVMIPINFSKKKNKSSGKELAIKALESVGMAELLKKPVNQLSGGQKQRVAIARAIVNRPNIILADEPTGALDSKTAAEIMDVFRTLNKSGKTVIIVTHDKTVAEKCDRIIELSDGEIVSDKSLSVS